MGVSAINTDYFVEGEAIRVEYCKKNDIVKSVSSYNFDALLCYACADKIKILFLNKPNMPNSPYSIDNILFIYKNEIENGTYKITRYRDLKNKESS